MNLFWKVKLLGVLLISFGGAPANATVWQVCNLELNITELATQPLARIRAIIVSVTPKTDIAECPSLGDEVFFIQEQQIINAYCLEITGRNTGIQYDGAICISMGIAKILAPVGSNTIQ